MEFAFTGSGNASDTTLIYFDQISVSLTSSASAATTLMPRRR
jgi:hypothetical protein